MSLASTLFALVGVGFVAVLASRMLMSFSRVSSQSEVSFRAQILSKNLIGLLNNEKVLLATIQHVQNNRAHGSAMNCLSDASPCTESGTPGGRPIEDRLVRSIRFPNQQEYLNLANPSQGFSLSGSVCTQFVAPPAEGNDQCPFRMEVYWSALCAPGSCVNPSFKLKSQLIYNPAQKSKKTYFNKSKYESEFYFSL